MTSQNNHAKSYAIDADIVAFLKTYFEARKDATVVFNHLLVDLQRTFKGIAVIRFRALLDRTADANWGRADASRCLRYVYREPVVIEAAPAEMLTENPSVSETAPEGSNELLRLIFSELMAIRGLMEAARMTVATSEDTRTEILKTSREKNPLFGFREEWFEKMKAMAIADVIVLDVPEGATQQKVGQYIRCLVLDRHIRFDGARYSVITHAVSKRGTVEVMRTE